MFNWPPERGDKVKVAIMTGWPFTIGYDPDSRDIHERVKLNSVVVCHEYQAMGSSARQGCVTYNHTTMPDRGYNVVPLNCVVPVGVHVPAVGDKMRVLSNPGMSISVDRKRLLKAGDVITVCGVTQAMATAENYGARFIMPCAQYAVDRADPSGPPEFSVLPLVDLELAEATAGDSSLQRVLRGSFESERPCTCDMTTLMRTGCSCGAISPYVTPFE